MEATRPNRKILRSPSVKRKNKTLPVHQRVQLERVLGLTSTSNAGLCCDSNSGTIAYPAGCVTVLFNPRRNKQSHIFNAHKKAVTAVAFSPDGKHLVTGETGHQPAVRVWDVMEKTQVAEFQGHKFGINCVAFSPNLKEVVSVGTQHDMMINVWNWKTGMKVASNKVSSKVSALAFSEDGKCFVTVGNRHVRFWYLEARSKINQTVPLMGRNGILGDQKDNFFCDVVAGQGSMSGRFFVITQSGLLCEFNEKRLLDKWVELMTKTASCITAGRDHIFVGCAEGVVRVFNATSLHYVCTLPPPHTLGVEVTTATSPSHLASNRQDSNYPDTKAIAVDDDHKKVTCIYNDRSIYIWDVHDLKRIGKAWSFLYHSGCIWALEMYPQLEEDVKPILPPGSFLTASGDNTIRVWNLNTHMPENTAYKRNIYSNELLKIVYADPTLGSLCNVDYNPAGATDKTDTTYDGKNGVRSIRVSPDGAHLASGDRQGNIRIYDMEYLTEQKCVEAHESDVMCLEYSYTKEGRLLATSSRDRLIHVFDVDANYGLVQTLGDHSSSITAVRFMDRDEKLRMVSCGADKSILLRNAVTSPDLQFQLEHHLATKITLYDMVIDPTQRCLATACQDRNVRLYNIQTTKEKKCYRGSAGDEGVLLRIHLDPSGTYAATSCTDKNVCILDFNTGELLATMYGHSEVITGVKFANDLKHIITVSADGCIFVWRLPKEMTAQIKVRLLELGKKLKDTDFLRCDEPLMPNPILLNSPSLDGNFQINKSSSLSLLPMKNRDAFDGRIDDDEEEEDEEDDEDDDEFLNGGSSSARINFSPGPLPSWAKAKFGDSAEKANGSGQEHVQPKGRWAQRVDHNIEFKSQLDLTQSEEESSHSDRRRTFAVDGASVSSSGSNPASMQDLRRETVVLNKKSHLGQDIRGSTGDLRATFTSTPKASRGSTSKSSTAPRDVNLFKSDTALNSSPTSPRRWSERFDLLRGNSVEMDDTDELDTGSDTTEIIYPPTESDFDPFASSYRVFAVENVRKHAPKSTTGSVSAADDGETSESTDPISLEDEDDANDETLISSAPTTPSDPDKDFLTPNADKEAFVRENFEEDSFSQLPLDKFLESTELLEQEATESETGTDGAGIGAARSAAVTTRPPRFESSAPFSPRLSLSARFMSRAGPSVFKAPLSTLMPNRPDSWLNRNKMEMSRAMDETRKSLLAMNSRNDFTGSDSPEKEDPPSPPTKLKEVDEEFGLNSSPGQFATSPPSAFGGRAKETGKDVTTSKQPGPVRTSVALSPNSPVRASPPGMVGPAARRITQERERRRSSSKSEAASTPTEDAKDKTLLGSTCIAGSASGPVAPRRTRPSYFKPTQSSKNKTSRNSDGGQEVGPKPISVLANANSGNTSSGSSGADMAGRLSSRMKSSGSKKSLYASSPNLLGSLDDGDDENNVDEEEEKERKKKLNKPKVTKKFTSTTNLRLLSDLSRSVPDVNDEGSSTDSSSTSSAAQGARTRTSNMAQTFHSSRLLSATGRRGSNSQINQISRALPTQPLRAVDIDEVQRTEASVGVPQPRRKTSASEMTLDQAKSILLGKSGLLASSSVSASRVTSDSGAGTSLRSASSRESTPNSLVPGSSPPTSNFDLASMSPAQRAIAQDIEQTANSLRHQQHSRGPSFSPQHTPPLSNLEMSPLDLPERDQPAPSQRRLAPKSLALSIEPPQHPQTFQHGPARSSSSNSTFVVPADILTSDVDRRASTGGSLEEDETSEEMNRSVRERIAQFQSNKPQQASQEPAERSRLSLPVVPHPISKPAHPPVSIAHCQSLVEDFQDKLSLLKDILSQVEGQTDDNSRQVMSLLGSAFHQSQQVVTELAARTPSPQCTSNGDVRHLNTSSTSSSSNQGPQNRTFHNQITPAVDTTSDGKCLPTSAAKTDVADSSPSQRSQELSSADIAAAFKDKLEPLLSHLSANLTQEVIKLIQDGK